MIDFVAQLQEHPDHLTVLGDGSQQKSYLDVSDCVAASSLGSTSARRFEVFNLGVDDHCKVSTRSGGSPTGWACRPASSSPGGDRGWVGDNPFIYLDTSAITATGWAPVHGIRDAVERTVDFLVANPWMLDGHSARR